MPGKRRSALWRSWFPIWPTEPPRGILALAGSKLGHRELIILMMPLWTEMREGPLPSRDVSGPVNADVSCLNSGEGLEGRALLSWLGRRWPQ